MRISREKARENRERVLAVASQRFRENGFDGVAVSDIMREAGFTHGGFYNHFASKEELAREAVASAWTAIAQERERAADIPELLAAYLSKAARGAPGKACPAAALAGDVARQGDTVKATFTEGLAGMIGGVADGLDGDDPAKRKLAIAVVSRMVGALMLSRAVPDDDPLAAEILSASREAILEELGRVVGKSEA
ncbi:TetR/AcrR family transcriptional regulator [Sphingobium sp. 3R8]|uniref:TetR/AcrR family transcriptional regulator n=1 Tax=Sphingobium sp. 3R8 TaxID=2874921 RepID=UPI001CCE5F1F|nr:TetR/AcrR family transcriptional regulator [Sphingobium sp. 3R8]MBZ9650258.1 TetR/AcrR family transcriptional regulator [Sphingobium sp. 3R8]